LYECTRDEYPKVQASILGTCRKQRSGGREYTTRFVVEKGKQGVRCWRVK